MRCCQSPIVRSPATTTVPDGGAQTQHVAWRPVWDNAFPSLAGPCGSHRLAAPDAPSLWWAFSDVDPHLKHWFKNILAGMEAAETGCFMVSALGFTRDQMRRQLADFCVSEKGRGFKLLRRGFQRTCGFSESAAHEVLTRGHMNLFLVMAAAQGSIDTVQCVYPAPKGHTPEPLASSSSPHAGCEPALAGVPDAM